MTKNRLRLGVNIDHVATVRNARGGALPDPVRAALLAVAAGADGITAHLREDRRHIRDADMQRLASELSKPLNFEIAATAEMIGLAERFKPHAACLVPEKREERTTEGGLDVVGQAQALAAPIARLKAAGCRVSLFIEADEAPIAMAAKLGAPVVELHTGTWCHAVADGHADKAEAEFQRLANGAAFASGSRSMPATGSTTTRRASSPAFRTSSSSTSGISWSAKRFSSASKPRSP
jgi:pyridoxine 5-phosphate synthase